MDINSKVYFVLNNWWSSSRSKKCHKQDKESSGPDTADDNSKRECPLDTKELGTATWKLLHSMAAYYPEKPTDEERRDMECFFQILAKHYPCSICAKELQKDLKANPPETESGKKLSLWLCQLHNRVNMKIGKPAYNCNNVFERWRDGWKDGSCE